MDSAPGGRLREGAESAVALTWTLTIAVGTIRQIVAPEELPSAPSWLGGPQVALPRSRRANASAARRAGSPLSSCGHGDT
ncbi:hypothetical protein ACFQ0P_11650 [Microbacterium insulae]|uniref:Uncharacterized protein n=1 Tax=Microbacterium insulae TaxID=483014 RepID=A0ABW3AJZ1_9MICO